MNTGILWRKPQKQHQGILALAFVVLGIIIALPPSGQINGTTTLTRIKTLLTVLVIFIPAILLGYQKRSPVIALLVTYLYYILIVFGTNSFVTTPPSPETLSGRTLQFLLVIVPTPTAVSVIGYPLGFVMGRLFDNTNYGGQESLSEQ